MQSLHKAYKAYKAYKSLQSLVLLLYFGSFIDDQRILFFWNLYPF